MSNLEPEFPDDIWADMPDDTYCKCGQTNVSMKTGQATQMAGLKFSLRLKCPVCGFWTNAVPTSNE